MTPAIKLLEKQGITHRVHTYRHDPSADSYGLEAASALVKPAEQIFKTLIVDTPNRGLCVGLIPVSSSLNMKAMAAAVGDKKATMADKNKAQLSSGYVLGGISPLAQKKPLTTVIDESAFTFNTIYVSGGKRGLDIELCPQTLATLCDSITSRIAN